MYVCVYIYIYISILISQFITLSPFPTVSICLFFNFCIPIPPLKIGSSVPFF